MHIDSLKKPLLTAVVAALGALGLTIPEEYGGLELDHVSNMLVGSRPAT